MTKTQKIIEARAIIKQDIGGLEARLSKLLTPKEMKALASELGNIAMARKLLEIALLDLSPDFKNKLSKLL